jgi:hypothetical protein
MRSTPSDIDQRVRQHIVALPIGGLFLHTAGLLEFVGLARRSSHDGPGFRILNDAENIGVVACLYQFIHGA